MTAEGTHKSTCFLVYKHGFIHNQFQTTTALMNNEGQRDIGRGKGTTFACDVSDLCVDQRPQVRDYDNFLLLAGFHLWLHSYLSRFVVLFECYMSHNHKSDRYSAQLGTLGEG